jgi:hypothetical protein
VSAVKYAERKANGGVEQLLRDKTAWSSQPQHALKAAAWSFGYLDHPIPGRPDFRRAFVALMLRGKDS